MVAGGGYGGSGGLAKLVSTNPPTKLHGGGGGGGASGQAVVCNLYFNRQDTITVTIGKGGQAQNPTAWPVGGSSSITYKKKKFYKLREVYLRRW